MILVYTHKITPRIKYIFKHIFTIRLGVEIDITSDLEYFKEYDSFKMSYHNFQISEEFHINCSEILQSHKIEDLEIEVENWNGLPIFFSFKENPFFQFDIFGASFYLISRYEEYLLHLKDDFGRFEPKSSLAFKNRFLNKPIVDFWIKRFSENFLDFYPDFKFRKNSFELKILIPVIKKVIEIK